jgi:hypothetical protein
LSIASNNSVDLKKGSLNQSGTDLGSSLKTEPQRRSSLLKKETIQKIKSVVDIDTTKSRPSSAKDPY